MFGRQGTVDTKGATDTPWGNALRQLPGRGCSSQGSVRRGKHLSLDRWLALVSIAALAGCSALPQSGPHYRNIAGQATVAVRSANQASALDYVLVEVSRDIIPYFNDNAVSSLRNANPRPNVGDVVEVTIFEAVTDTGGLFVPAQAGRTANFVTLPAQAIDENGNISIPYAGQVRIAGRSLNDVQQEIESRLANRAIEPQVTIATTLNERRTYVVFGASGAQGRFDFGEVSLSLGEALAKAGGLLDNRANPAHVFVYRLVARSTLVTIGADVSAFSGQYVPVVFRVNLADPSMLFAAQGFVMQDKDIVFISNAPSVEMSKVMDIFNNVSNTSANVPTNAVNTTNALDTLTD
jgi:protein involved in polysaccharide export with SLBB domain